MQVPFATNDNHISLSRMRRETFARILIFIVVGLFIGAVSWAGVSWALPFSLLLPLAYGFTKKRRECAVLCAGYFLAASRGLPLGAATYFGTDILPGLILWIAASSVFILTYTVLWNARPARKLTGFLLATILMAVPPLGVLGWASPLTAAGMMFPGWSWIGLIAVLILCALLCQPRTRHWGSGLATLAAISGLLMGRSTTVPEGWEGVSTNVEFETGVVDFEKSYELLKNARRIAGSTQAKVLVFPEGAAGWRTPTMERSWTRLAAQNDKIIIAGYEDALDVGSDNAVAIFTNEGMHTLYKQRMPVPLSMWKPWTRHSTHAYWFEAPSVRVEGKRAAVLICYEQLLIWPILQSASQNPDVLIGVANDWWAADTNIPAIQDTVLESWGRLFGADVVKGFNT